MSSIYKGDEHIVLTMQAGCFIKGTFLVMLPFAAQSTLIQYMRENENFSLFKDCIESSKSLKCPIKGGLHS